MSLFQGYIERQLKAELSKYVEGTFNSRFSLNGDLTLQHLHLKPDAIPAWSPLVLVAGYVGLVHVEIPVFNLGSKPIKISVEDVLILLRPRGESERDEGKEVALQREDKLARAAKECEKAAREAAGEGGGEGGGSGGKKAKDKGFFGRLKDKILNNAQVRRESP
jgi:hypothetical protein